MRDVPRRLAEVSWAPRPILGDISIVIPTLGRPILESCLASIAAGTAWPARIIVVDQTSSPSVAAWLEELDSRGLRTRYLPSTQRGRSAGVNRGLEQVDTTFAAVTDDDCLVEADWLEHMLAKLKRYPDAIVSGRVEALGDHEVVAVATSREPAVYDRPRLTFDAMSGGNMGTSRATVERVGPFDEDPRLATAEDGDWAYRALRAGVCIVYAPEVCVWHYGWRDADQRLDQYRAYARSHGGFYGKHLRRGDGFIALRACYHLLRSLRRLLRGALTGNREHAAHGRAYFTGLVPGILAGLRKGPK